MKGINNPIGIKSLLPIHNPFIMNAYRFAGVNWATALLNWAKRKEITINGAAKTADAVWGTNADQVIDDFTTYTDQTDANLSWTPNDNVAGKRVNVANDNLEFDLIDDGTNNGIAYDLGTAVSDTTWILRGKIDITSISNPSAFNQLHWFGISSTDETAAGNSAQNFLGFGMYLDSAGSHKYYIRAAYSANLNAGIDASEYFTRALSAETLYIEIIRLSSTKFRVTMFSDSEYTDVLESKDFACASTITGLRYVVMKNQSNTSRNGTFSGTLDDVKLWEGVTVVENIPSQQTATYSDNLSTSTDINVAGGTVLTYGTNEINFDLDAYANAEEIYWDLDNLTGLTVSDMDCWTVRMRMDIDTFTQGSSGAQYQLGVGISSLTNNFRANQDFMGFFFKINSGGAKLYSTAVDGVNIHDGTETLFTSLPATGDVIYWELVKNGDTITVNWYSDSAFSVLVETQSSTDAGITGLRYLKITNDTLGSVDHEAIGSIDDIEFYANISEVNPATLTDYPLTIKIQGDADLKEKTAETEELDYTTAESWTKVGTTVTVDDAVASKVDFNATAGNADHRVHKALGSTLSDSLWTAHIEMDLDTNAGGIWIPWMFTAGTLEGGENSQDGIGIMIRGNGAPSNFDLLVNNGGTLASTNGGLDTVDGTKYFIEMSRLSTTEVRATFYIDKAHTILAPAGSGVNPIKLTISSGITGLTHVQHGANFTSVGGAATLSCQFDNLKIWDGITNPVTQETATLDDDFTSSGATSHTSDNTTVGGWLAQDISMIKVNGANDNMDFNFDNDSTNDAISYDLGYVVDNNKWVLRADMTVTTSITNGVFGFGLSDSDSTEGNNTAQNFVGARIDKNGSTTIRNGALDKEGAVLNVWGVAGEDVQTLTVGSDPFTLYIEIKRLGATSYRTSIFSDSSYSVLLGDADGVCTASTDSLRYIKIVNADDVTFAGEMSGTIDNVKFWNGITSPNAEGRKIVFTDNAFDGDAVEYASETVSYDPINGDLEAVVKIPALATGADTTIQMYYDYAATNPSYVPELFTSMPTADSVFGVNGDQVIEDCTTYTNTTEGDADYVPSVTGTNECRLNPSTNVIDCRFEDASPDHFVTYRDLTGATITDNAWTLRCKVATTVITAPSGGLSHSVFIGMSSNTSNFASSQDFLGISFWNAGASASPNTPKHYAVYRDGAIGGFSTQAPAASSVAFTTAWTNSDTYYIEIIRVSDTELTVELFNDSAYTTSVEKQTVIVPSTVTALRYFKAGVYDNANVVGFTMTIDDLEFWEGVNKNREQSTYDSNYKAVYNLHGNSVDSTAYGNDGTDTAVDYEQQNNSVGASFNATTTIINGGNDASLANIWDGGGTLTVTFNTGSDGEGNTGRLVDKRNLSAVGWQIYTSSESGGFLDITMSVDFSGTDAKWETGVTIPINELHTLVIKYNSDSVSNNPIFIINGVKYTVINGLITRTTTPTGTRTDDTAEPFIIGNADNASKTFDGFLDNVSLSDVSRPSSHAITSYNAEKSDSDIITAGDENTQ